MVERKIKMRQEYVELVNKFKKLSDEQKMTEILSNINELLRLLYITNKSFNEANDALPVINNYSNESEYFDALFTNIISLKEETAKLINNSR